MDRRYVCKWAMDLLMIREKIYKTMQNACDCRSPLYDEDYHR